MVRLAVSLLCLMAGMGTLKAEAERPNILVILCDDLGYGDLGLTGSTEIKTPVLDKLAANGAICSNGYVTHPYCGPSRAGLITGRYQARFGMEINPSYSPYDRTMGLPLTERTFADRLQKVGYRTGVIGKWHMGAAPEFHPNNRGFDYFYGFLSGGHTYFPEQVSSNEPLVNDQQKMIYHVNEGCLLPLMRNNNAAEFDEYLTTALSRDAARFVQRSESPFCLYLAYNAPHAPLEAPEELIAEYAHIQDPQRRIYAAMVDAMDQGIGMIVDALAESGKLDNTLIFFLSDNGGIFPKPFKNKYDAWGDSGPFKRGKGSMMEGGSHVPFIAHWPAKIKRGTVIDGLVSSLDIAATAVAIGNGDASGHELEGVNLVPYFTGEKTDSPHETLFWRTNNNTSWAVRTVKAKYLKESWNHPDGIQLFDMQNDPYEDQNILAQRPEMRAELAQRWNMWNAGNINNILDEAPVYHSKRLQLFEEQYQKKIKDAAKKKPLVIE
ncbi:Arylsulfatase [Pontiella sulfatireligans]|uniref:Arylsulfatase n=2 Tax=Pontiella sulfatireligans TaxID=2750658 RepID=A0A6C2UQF7_9BACT|nr:sulfatase S1_19 [Kiritimatiellales bacterium]VGO22448.1 Arylsulfatase [Pontiella sulfatireligans]